MKIPTISALTFILLLTFSCSSSANDHDDFLECLSEKFHNYSSISNLVYTPRSSSFPSILLSSTWNQRYTTASTPKPQVIITPEHESQIPPIVLCARDNDMEIRTRSGGHDFEGRSFVSEDPFVIIDMIKLSQVTVNAEAKTAWVGAGATLGILYYSIAEKSPTLAFPAADNIIDARIVDVKGRILNRKSMGEDLFWAIRGGGGGSFGVIISFKVQLVDVPEKITVFNIHRTLQQNATQLIHRWQYIAPKFEKDLHLFINAGRTSYLTGVNSNQEGRNISLGASFYSLFLGRVDRLLSLMQESFPELGLVQEDCIEMSWIQSALFFQGFPIDSREILLNRTIPKTYVKVKSNYAQSPIPAEGIGGIWRFFYEREGENSPLIMYPYGGRMAEIPESETPYPHRNNLFHMSNIVYWQEEEAQNTDKYLSWSSRLYNYLTPYVENSPRASYFNYRDLDLGVNNPKGKTSYAQASIWGKKYF
ncbi:hypothetical protein ACS0TY_018979 [Phlomoides rotata]